MVKLHEKVVKLDEKEQAGKLKQHDIDEFSSLIAEAEVAKINPDKNTLYNEKLKKYKSALLTSIYTPKLTTLQQKLDKKLTEGSLQQSDIDEFSSLITEAENAKIDPLKISPFNRKLRDYEEELEKKSKEETRSRLRHVSQAIEKTFKPVKNENNVDTAFRGLLHVYEKYPPKEPTYTLDQIRQAQNPPSLHASLSETQESINDGKGYKMEARKSALKRMLLHAQRDYHPDRNQGTERDDLEPLEWETISLTITQQLAQIYDKIFKGARKLEGEGGSRKRRRTRRRRKSRKYK